MPIEDHLQALRKAATWSIKSPLAKDQSLIKDGGVVEDNGGTSGELGDSSLEVAPWMGKLLDEKEKVGEDSWGVISGSGGSVKSEKGVGYQAVFFDPRYVCGARIGSKNLLCLVDQGQCQVKSHKHSELSGLKSGKYIGISKVVAGSEKPPGTIVADCCLSTNVIPIDTLESWTGTTASLQEWQSMFATLEGSEESGLMTPAKLRSRSAQLLTASKSLRKEFEDESITDDSITISSGWRNEFNDWNFSPTKVGPERSILQEEALFAQKDLSTQVMQNFRSTQHIGSMVDHTAEAVKKLKDITESESSHAGKSFGSMHVKIRSIGMQLGQPSPHSPYASLWGAAAALQHGLTEVEEKLQNIPSAKELSLMFQKLNSLPSPETIRQESDKLQRFVITSLEQQEKKVPDYAVQLQSDMQGVDKWIGSVTGMLAQIPQRQNSLEQSVKSLMSSTFPPSMGNLGSPHQVQVTAAELQALRTELASFKKEIGELKAAKEDGTVSFGNVTFRSKAEVSAWLTQHNSNKESWEQFVDPLIMLQRLVDSNKKDGMIRRHVDNQRTGIKTELESCTLDSLQHPIPEIFHKGAATFARRMDESPLDQLKKAEDWLDGQEGLKPHLTHLLDNLVSHWLDQAHNECHTPEMRALVNHMITEAERFIAGMADFVDSQYRSLTKTSKFGTAQSWALSMRLLKRILDDLYVPKRAHVKTIDLTNRTDTAATILWTSLCTLKVASVYLKGGFAKHSSIASEYVAFWRCAVARKKWMNLLGRLQN